MKHLRLFLQATSSPGKHGHHMLLKSVPGRVCLLCCLSRLALRAVHCYVGPVTCQSGSSFSPRSQQVTGTAHRCVLSERWQCTRSGCWRVGTCNLLVPSGAAWPGPRCTASAQSMDDVVVLDTPFLDHDQIIPRSGQATWAAGPPGVLGSGVQSMSYCRKSRAGSNTNSH